MNTWAVMGIIILVMGIIVGNLMLIKHSAKQPFPTSKKDNNASYDKDEAED
jgi:hypothetical protein